MHFYMACFFNMIAQFNMEIHKHASNAYFVRYYRCPVLDTRDVRCSSTSISLTYRCYETKHRTSIYSALGSLPYKQSLGSI